MLTAIESRVADRLRMAHIYAAKSTQRNLEGKLRRVAEFFGDSITQEKLDAYIAERLKVAQVSTVNYELDQIKTILRPGDGVVIRKIKDRRDRGRIYLTEDEIARLLSHLKGQAKDLTLAYLYTGCRLKELLYVKPADLRDRPGFIRVYNLKTARSGYDSVRYVPIHDAIKGILPIKLKEGIATYRRALKKAALAAGITIDVTPKLFRATFASLLVTKGAQIQSVSSLLGHASIQTTQKHYAHLAPSVGVETVAKLGTLG